MCELTYKALPVNREICNSGKHFSKANRNELLYSASGPTPYDPKKEK